MCRVLRVECTHEWVLPGLVYVPPHSLCPWALGTLQFSCMSSACNTVCCMCCIGESASHANHNHRACCRIVAAREEEPITTTQQLVRAIGSPGGGGRGGGKRGDAKYKHPATRTFQVRFRLTLKCCSSRTHTWLPVQKCSC